jgi:hypothetical protein
MFNEHRCSEHRFTPLMFSEPMFSKLKLSEPMFSEIKLGEISFAETGHLYSMSQAWIH